VVGGAQCDILHEIWAGAFACTDHLNIFWPTSRVKVRPYQDSNSALNTRRQQLALRDKSLRPDFILIRHCEHIPALHRFPFTLAHTHRRIPTWRQSEDEAAPADGEGAAEEWEEGEVA
jgi:hypothetical protein